MADEEVDGNTEIDTAQCGACRAEIPANSTSCPECKVKFSGLEDVDMGECGSCSAIVPLDSKNCPECDISFVLDDLLNDVNEWMTKEDISVTGLFGKWDTNDDGVLSGNEIRAGLLEAKLAVLPRAEIDRFMHQLDINQDDEISLDELRTGLNLPEKTSPEEQETDSETKESTSKDDETPTEIDADEEVDEESKKDDSEDVDEEDTTDDSGDAEEADIDDSEDHSDDSESDDSDEHSREGEPEEDGDESEEEPEKESEESNDEVFSLIDKFTDLVRDAEDSIRATFTEFDGDNNQLVSSEEFKEMINANFEDEFSEEQIDEMINAIDTDEDGNIDLIEFVDAVESPDKVKETVEEKKREGPTKNQIWLMRNEENIFPILWSVLGVGIISVMINVFGFFANVFKCDEGDNTWLLAQEWCTSHGKLNILNIFNPSDAGSWSETGSWGIPDIFLIILFIGLLGASIWARGEVKGWKELYRKKKSQSDDEPSEESTEDDTDGNESDGDEEPEDSDDSDEESDEDDEDDSDDDDSDADDDDNEDSDDDEDDEEIEIGSHVGVDHEDEEWYGVILKFDEDDDEVLVKDDDSGEEYWVPFDALFVD